MPENELFKKENGSMIRQNTATDDLIKSLSHEEDAESFEGYDNDIDQLLNEIN